jgi:Triosephosphate isomerase
MHPSRTPLVIANWKMNKTPSEAAVFCDDFLSRLPALPERVELAIAPAFPALERVGRHLLPTRVKLGAQDVHVEPKGAHTGEVSVAMLADVGVAMVLVGHSERRRDRKEVEADFTRKMKRLADAGLSPVYCVGETLEERDGGRTEGVLAAQMTALDAFGDALPPGFVLAYEPVWAIGTGGPRRPRWRPTPTPSSAAASPSASAPRPRPRRGSSTAGR